MENKKIMVLLLLEVRLPKEQAKYSVELANMLAKIKT